MRRDGSAALDLAAVACGRFEGFWEFGLHSWDTAAGVLLVREAGGTVTQFDGQPYQLGDRELLASNGRVHAEMQEVAAGIAERAASRPPLVCQFEKLLHSRPERPALHFAQASVKRCIDSISGEC